MKDSATAKVEAAAGIGLALGAAALGAFLMSRKTRDASDDAPWFTRRGKDVVGRTVTIRKPRAELYAFWREFSNLAQFMEIGTWEAALGTLATAAAPEKWNYPGEGVGKAG